MAILKVNVSTLKKDLFKGTQKNEYSKVPERSSYRLTCRAKSLERPFHAFQTQFFCCKKVYLITYTLMSQIVAGTYFHELRYSRNL